MMATKLKSRPFYAITYHNECRLFWSTVVTNALVDYQKDRTKDKKHTKDYQNDRYGKRTNK